MDCSKCIKNCKAACCGIVPFEKKFVKNNKPLRKVIKEHEFKGMILLETKGYICPYLKEDYTCSVYDKRPEVCRLFGNESHIMLTCQFQDKDGNIRSRQNRRSVGRKISKNFNPFN